MSKSSNTYTLIQPHVLAISIAVSMGLMSQTYAESSKLPIDTADKRISNTALANVNAQNQIYQMTRIVIQAEKEDTIQFGQSVLNQKAIDRYQANNVAQLLDNMPSVGSAGSPRPGGQTINILGMGGVEDVPISLDNSIKSFDKYRQGSVFIEPEILKKITVDKGPHNVEVGNGGFGGKVTLETKDATDLLVDDNHIGAFLKYSRFSNNAQNTYTGAVYAQTKNGLADGMLYYTNRDSGDVKRPDGSKFLYSAQEQDTYLVKLNFHPTDSQKITLNAMQRVIKGGSHLRLCVIKTLYQLRQILKNMAMRKLGNVVWFIVIRAI